MTKVSRCLASDEKQKGGSSRLRNPSFSPSHPSGKTQIDEVNIIGGLYVHATLKVDMYG